jgi:hypothetical protein
VILTQNGIPVHTSQPSPASRIVQDKYMGMVQSYHQIESASPSQTASSKASDFLIVSSLKGREIRFNPVQRSKIISVSGPGVGV